MRRAVLHLHRLAPEILAHVLGVTLRLLRTTDGSANGRSSLPLPSSVHGWVRRRSHRFAKSSRILWNGDCDNSLNYGADDYGPRLHVRDGRHLFVAFGVCSVRFGGLRPLRPIRGQRRSSYHPFLLVKNITRRLVATTGSRRLAPSQDLPFISLRLPPGYPWPK